MGPGVSTAPHLRAILGRSSLPLNAHSLPSPPSLSRIPSQKLSSGVSRKRSTGVGQKLSTGVGQRESHLWRICPPLPPQVPVHSNSLHVRPWGPFSRRAQSQRLSTAENQGLRHPWRASPPFFTQSPAYSQVLHSRSWNPFFFRLRFQSQFLFASQHSTPQSQGLSLQRASPALHTAQGTTEGGAVALHRVQGGTPALHRVQGATLALRRGSKDQKGVLWPAGIPYLCTPALCRGSGDQKGVLNAQCPLDTPFVSRRRFLPAGTPHRYSAGGLGRCPSEEGRGEEAGTRGEWPSQDNKIDAGSLHSGDRETLSEASAVARGSPLEAQKQVSAESTESTVQQSSGKSTRSTAQQTSAEDISSDNTLISPKASPVTGSPNSLTAAKGVERAPSASPQINTKALSAAVVMGASGAAAWYTGGLLVKRLTAAILTVPSPSACVFTVTLLLAAAGPLGACAMWAEAFSLPHARLDWGILLKAVFIPCLAEELLWRAALLPHPRLEAATTTPDQALFWCILSTILYVLAHPLLAYAIRPQALALFGHPGFLSCCAILGGICAAAYRQSGSVWTAVFLHWAVVAVWLTLGGRHKAPL